MFAFLEEPTPETDGSSIQSTQQNFNFVALTSIKPGPFMVAQPKGRVKVFRLLLRFLLRWRCFGAIRKARRNLVYQRASVLCQSPSK